MTEKEIEEKALRDAMANYSKMKKGLSDESNIINPTVKSDEYKPSPQQPTSPTQMPTMSSGNMGMEELTRESDPDLMIPYELVDLPSKGIFYPNGLNQVKVEYMTSADEDILSTPSLIENGTVLDVLLRNKIKTDGVNINDLFDGDKNAILLFLRASSYGEKYEVMVTDPATNKPFKTNVDLTKLKYKFISDKPDEKLEFSFLLPRKKKNVKYKLLTSGEEAFIKASSLERKEAYNKEFDDIGTSKLKAQITEIEGNRDQGYINRFVDALIAYDSLKLRSHIMSNTPSVDMTYEFVSPSKVKFKAKVNVSVDFFFPQD